MSKALKIRFIGLTAITVFTLIFSITYLIPAVKKVSRIRRELRTLQVQFNDLNTEEIQFVFSTREERLMFRTLNRQFKTRLPHVIDTGALKALCQRNISSVLTLARTTLLSVLQVESLVKDPELSQEKSYGIPGDTSFRSRYEEKKRSLQTISQGTPGEDVLSALFTSKGFFSGYDGLQFYHLLIAWRGDINTIIRFVHGIAAAVPHSLIYQFEIFASASGQPMCCMVLRVFFFSSVHFGPNIGWWKDVFAIIQAPLARDIESLIIDINSELLRNAVTRFPFEPFKGQLASGPFPNLFRNQ